MKKRNDFKESVFRRWKDLAIGILGFIMVLQLIINVMLINELRSSTPVVTTVPITTTPTIPPQMDNEIRFGSLYESDYEAHNLMFTGLVGHDEARKDQIYVSAGSIDFDLRTTPDIPHILNVYVTNLNDNCRKDEVYVDGVLIGSMNKKTNEVNPKTTYTFPNINTTSGIIHVRILGGGNPNQNPNECDWGHDITAVQLI